MMRPCEKCLENNWTYEKIEDTIRATCKLCGYEVEFAARKPKQSKKKKQKWDKVIHQYGHTTILRKPVEPFFPF
jgi:DNA-directed RNA polymerase subunit M/transcription elongation factor TFIIS